MATIHAVATVSAAVLALLERARFDDIKDAELAIATTADLRATPPREGVTLTLCRISPNQTLRNPPPTSDPTRRRSPPPLPVDLHYLLTAWAPRAGRQQLLLSWAMRTLEDTPVLSAATLNRGAPAEVFRESEAVELSRESTNLADLELLWRMLGAPSQPAVTYVVRTVLLDSSS